MVFIETSVFTKEIRRLLSDADYKELQIALMLRPYAGDLIRGSNGLRKVRWNLPGEGKRGGIRVIYYWDPPDTVFMLFLYKKTDQDDLTAEQIRILKKLVKEWLQ
jgi:hypothetical protein